MTTPKRKRRPKPPESRDLLVKPFVGNDASDPAPCVPGWTPEQYHADRTRLTRGMLADFLTSPALFKGRWVDGTIPPKPQTDAMRLGSAFHSLLFGDLTYAVWDGGRRAGKDWERFVERAAKDDATVLTRSQFTSLTGMVDAVRADKFVGECMQHSEVRREHVVAWTDEDTGLRCKAMIDCLVGADGGGVVLDWKSTTDPQPDAWVPASRRLGSHLQVSHYLEGLWHVYGHYRWVYVVVGNEPPHDVWLLEPGPEVIEVGDAQCAEALAGIREMLDAPPGSPWRHASAGTVCEYTYPSWYLRETEGGER